MFLSCHIAPSKAYVAIQSLCLIPGFCEKHNISHHCSLTRTLSHFTCKLHNDHQFFFLCCRSCLASCVVQYFYCTHIFLVQFPYLRLWSQSGYFRRSFQCNAIRVAAITDNRFILYFQETWK